VLECFEVGELMEKRHVCKRLGIDLIPKCFKRVRYVMPFVDQEDRAQDSLYQIVQNPNTVIIENIQGGEQHVERLNIIAENVGRNCKKLKLFFEENEVDSQDLAKKYVEIFRKFS